MTELSGPSAESLHDRLSRAGFRRSHNIAYSPVCPACRSCIPIRIVADTFRPSRTHRKLRRQLAGVTVSRMPARASAEQFSLFQRYQRERHQDGDMAAMGFYDYRAMVEDTPISTGMVEFRDPQGALLGACLTDWLSDGLSAVYSFYAPELQGLGTLAILWLVEEAQRSGLPYVYLGYWVPQSQKMAYKAAFRPAEVLRGGIWRTLEVPADASAPVRLCVTAD